MNSRSLQKKLGKPDLMPLQRELAEHDRQDLRGAVARFGGQSKVADSAGLLYRGPIVAPDGSKRYWTHERIGQFLHEVANKEGHPGVMPTTSAVKKHAGKSAKTVVTIFTRSASSWYGLAKRHGLQYEKGKHAVTQGFIKSFVKSLGDAIYHLTPAEIYVLFEQYGISKAGNNLRQGRSFDNLIDAIQRGCLPRHELENWTSGKRSALIDSLVDKDIKTVEEAFQNARQELQKAEHKENANDKDNVPYREDVENQLPTPTAGNILNSLKVSTDILDQASSDEEAVEFLIAKATDKLWKKCFHDEESTVLKAKEHQGNLYSESARDAFIEEYSRCQQLPIPEGYSFSDPAGLECQPKLMQRLIAYRVLQRDRVLNLSGTGTGKTLSAILASRVIRAKLTIITCPNAIVDTWRNNILNAFPQSEVLTKPANWAVDWETRNIPRYLVINHEMLQNRNEAAIKQFIRNNPYDLVVIDELQQVKQRDIRSESQRRRLLTGIITDIPEGRPKPRVLGMTATPIINNLQEGKSLVELVTSVPHDDIDTRHNIQNCMRMYRRFTALGFRMLPKSEVSREPQICPVDATPFLDKLISLGPRPHPQKVEAALLRAKWPIIRNHLKKKTVIFTEYVQGIVLELAELISQAGFTVGIHTGQERLSTEPEYHDSLQQFMAGNTDVLIASIKTLATGVDGLQYVSNNVIFASLPWTSTDYDQAVGRFDREGMAFDKLDICIPKTYVALDTGKKWSWCDSKLKRLENKRDISKAAVDGEIPDPESQLTPEKATQY